MPRAPRTYDDDAVLHVINRGNDRRRLFAGERDYAAFLGLMAWARARTNLRLVAYVVMPNHWHLVAWPRTPAELSQFMRDVTGAHAAIIRTESGTKGTGHVYQDRYHAFVIDSERGYFRTLRYVEANPVRAGLVVHAQQWRWSSLHERLHDRRLITDGPAPLPRPVDWVGLVNVGLTPEEMSALRPRRPRRGIAKLWEAHTGGPSRTHSWPRCGM